MTTPEHLEATRKELKEPEEIQDLEDIKLHLAFARERNDKSTTPEDIEEDANAYFKQIHAEPKLGSFQVIKNMADEVVATGYLQSTSCLGDFDKKFGAGGAYVRDQAVHSKFTGQNLGKKITDARLEKAKELGFDCLYSDILNTNLASLVPKFKDGFKAIKIEEYQPGRACFLMKKEVNPVKNEQKTKGRQEKIPLSDLDQIADLLENDKWEGTGIKNISGIKHDPNPESWVVIMEKIK